MSTMVCIESDQSFIGSEKTDHSLIKVWRWSDQKFLSGKSEEM